MFSFLPLINNSVIFGLSFLLLSMSAIISSKTINILRLLFGFYSSMFSETLSLLFEYLMKTLESLKCFVPTSSRFLIKNSYFASFRSLAYK